MDPMELAEREKRQFKEIYLPESYRNNLLDKLHNLHQASMLDQDNMTKFDDLTLYYEVQEDHYQVISRFYSGLISEI